MPLFTIGDEGDELKDGTYEMVLISVTPKTITPKQGDDAGKELSGLEWEFVDSEDDELTVKGWTRLYDVLKPKSNMIIWTTALLGAEAIRKGASFDERDLIGRKALITIKNDENGWPKIVSVSALPTRRNVRAAAEATAGDQTDLPF